MTSYEVLKELDEELAIFGKFDNVLLIGFGDGGFIEYSSETATKTFGIDAEQAYNHHKKKFDSMKGGNVRLLPGDVFATRPLSLTKGEKIDVLILNLPLNLFRSLNALQNFLPALKKNGKVLISLELDGQPPETVKHLATKMLGEIKLSNPKYAQPMVMPFAKNNLYVLLRNSPPDKEMEVIVLN